MKAKRIVITGGPATGKTSLIQSFKKQYFICFDEISRQITLDARKEGIEQLFLTNPLLFSELLLKGRLQQYHDANELKSNVIFYDRGIPDVLAYMDYANQEYSNHFVESCHKFRYDMVFILAPWKVIFESDNERYESFDQAIQIHDCLVNTYKNYSYSLVDVPFDTIEKRTQFILNHINFQ